MVTAVGCGLAGFTHEEIAPLFSSAPDNCWFDTLWKPILGDSKKYWGTFKDGAYQLTPEYEAALTAAGKQAIFTYGSNEAGIHGAGAAAFAMRNRGAVYGFGIGRKGCSYGIPTKDQQIQTLPMKKVQEYIKNFLAYASKRV